MDDRIEILGEELIDEHPELALEVLAASARLSMPLGWHYLLDIVWILSRLDLAPGATVLDAGAGYGLFQFLLAERGYRVLSADMLARRPRGDLSRFYRFEHLAGDGPIRHEYFAHHGWARRLGPRQLLGGLLDLRLRDLPGRIRRVLSRRPEPPPGDDRRPVIVLYECDLEDMTALGDGSVDGAVSLSALEHNEPAKAAAVAREIERVVAPGGPILHTVSATAEGAVFHEPSFSWMLDEAGLAETYGLETPISNFDRYEERRAALADSRYLSRWLHLFYYESGRNGMPWGKWDPQYLPVGVAKLNRPRAGS